MAYIAGYVRTLHTAWVAQGGVLERVMAQALVDYTPEVILAAIKTHFKQGFRDGGPGLFCQRLPQLVSKLPRKVSEPAAVEALERRQERQLGEERAKDAQIRAGRAQVIALLHEEPAIEVVARKEAKTQGVTDPTLVRLAAAMLAVEVLEGRRSIEAIRAATGVAGPTAGPAAIRLDVETVDERAMDPGPGEEALF
jgi:hypothetical protein